MSLEIPRGRGVLKATFLEEMCKNKLEFPGGMGGAKQKTFHGGSMDIFWNCTVCTKLVVCPFLVLVIPAAIISSLTYCQLFI